MASKNSKGTERACTQEEFRVGVSQVNTGLCGCEAHPQPSAHFFPEPASGLQGSPGLIPCSQPCKRKLYVVGDMCLISINLGQPLCTSLHFFFNSWGGPTESLWRELERSEAKKHLR